MLARSCVRRIRIHVQPRRTFGDTTRALPSKVYTDPSSPPDASTTTAPQDLTREQKRVLEAALRIDQAGEVAANYIYMGQLAVLGRDRVCGPLIQVSIVATN